MVICSKEIENVLYDIYFSEFAQNVNTPRYYAIKEKLLNLDKTYLNRRIGRYPAWKRSGMFEIQIGCHILGYSWDGTTACIEEYFKDTVRENLQYKNIRYNIMKTNKDVVRLTESKLRNIIAESVKKVLSELDWKTYANAASAAKDRESIFKNVPDYPYNPMRRHYNDDGTLDMDQYERDSEHVFNQSQQPEKFRNCFEII
jgi:hypothetical protein